MKISILFFHFDLGNGGAEKVLVNLANSLDPEKYDVTVKTLFNYGVNIDSLSPKVKRDWVFNFKPFRGITYILKLFSPRLLHRLMIHNDYDVEVAFIEGSPTRIISGCSNKSTRLYAWIHIEIGELRPFFHPYRSMREVEGCYKKFRKIAFVSKSAQSSFITSTGWDFFETRVIHNVLDIDNIVKQSLLEVPISISKECVNICSVGRLNAQKGYERLIRVLSKLNDDGKSNWHLYLMGQGEEHDNLEKMVKEACLERKISFLGYVQPPYPYVSKMDLFVCSSFREGYSTAVSESIIVGTPVLTTDCSGMQEILGERAGIIVENSEQGLFDGLNLILSNPSIIAEMKNETKNRSKIFSKESAIREFEIFINE